MIKKVAVEDLAEWNDALICVFFLYVLCLRCWSKRFINTLLHVPKSLNIQGIVVCG